MSEANATLGEASWWRADYERQRELYGVASKFVTRLRAELIQACCDVRLTRLQRDMLLEIVNQIDDERRGR